MSLLDTLRIKLNEARRELLDLTARNRLLNAAITRKRSSRLDIVDEDPDVVYELLVLEGRPLGFAPAPEPAPDSPTPLVSDSSATTRPEEGTAEVATERRRDRWLQTALAANELRRRLVNLYRDARSFEEELGVGILYLALGFLKWYEPDNSQTPRYAPLVLVPVRLDRLQRDRFRVRYSGEDLCTNISLQERLRADYLIDLPDVPDDLEDLRPTEYAASVREAVGNREGWEVLPDRMVLWFFSFSKFLMYRDLDPSNWPDGARLEEHPLIRGLLHEGFRPEPPLCGEEERLDGWLAPSELLHVLDADSSQAIVIEEAKRGRNLVVQGPPGTGKSQTIANLIAAAVAAGKRVLFVAEKRAALEVVKRRLDRIGLGALCLELHSQKANKKDVLEELRRTLELGPPIVEDVESVVTELEQLAERLNRHVESIHQKLSPSDMSAYEAASWLVRLQVLNVPPPPFELPDAARWDKATYRMKEACLRDVLVHLERIGSPSEHPWRGVGLEAILPPDAERLTVAARSLIQPCQRLLEDARNLASLLQQEPDVTLAAIESQVQFARHLLAAPAGALGCVSNPVWDQEYARLTRLVESGLEWQTLQEKLEGIVAETAWDTDLAQTRRDLAETGRAWLRWLFPRYRRAMAVMRSVLRVAPPRSLDQRLALLDDILRGQKLRAELTSAEADRLGHAAFGPLWAGIRSDWKTLGRIVDWERGLRELRLPLEKRTLLADLGHGDSIAVQTERVAEELQTLRSRIEGLFARLKLDLQGAFDVQDVTHVPLDELTARLQEWSNSPRELQEWIVYRHRLQALREAGLDAVADAIQKGELSPDVAPDQLRYAWCVSLLRVAFAWHPELARFDGASHEAAIARYRELDSRRIELARQQVARLHYERLPGRGADVGEMGILRRELAKKRRHMPLRKLFSQAGRAIQRIKPVFMMSPLSVAQFLAPGRIEFDLVVMDEASQIRPVDALGAIARGQQLVVVGDDRQLPPTTFFDRLVSGDDTGQAEEDVETRDLESILDLCRARNMSQRMLRWHYRSRHHSLIAVSNRFFYDNRLWVIPSPTIRDPELGLRFHYVPDGVFDRGGTARNRREAEVVVEAILEHARRWPEKSLGVGTFSVAQRDEILDQLDARLAEYPELESFFSPDQEEPFFVKNLENIQGDERDVIFISVGYGPDERGMISMNFGPLNHAGGERRLNVLITRARERCEVFASITADHIDLTRTQAAGVRALKEFLRFAATGELDEAGFSQEARDTMELPLEKTIAEWLSANGYETDFSIGMAGIFVDVGVRDPGVPDRYVLGVQSDGPHYARPRWARDRDRIQPAVLADRGWRTRRVWVLDAVRQPDHVLSQIIKPTDPANTDPLSDNAVGESVNGPSGSATITRCSLEQKEENESGVVPYVVATRELAEKGVHGKLDTGAAVARVIDIEGPIHRDELIRRVADLLGVERVTSRFRRQVLEFVRAGATAGDYIVEDGFVWPASRKQIPVRDRSGVDLRSLRDADTIPPMEIRSALLAVVRAGIGVTPDEAASKVAQMLGFRAVFPALRTRIYAEVRRLLEQGLLCRRHGRLYTERAAENAEE